MSERRRIGSGEEIDPNTERKRIINTFKSNLDVFMDTEEPDMRLIDINFVPNAEELTIAHFVGDQEANIPYSNIDLDFKSLFAKYTEWNFPPIITSSTFELQPFSGMSEKLAKYVGQPIECKTVIYKLASFNDENVLIYKDRYSLPKDNKVQINEQWTAKRSKIMPSSESDTSPKGKGLEIPHTKALTTVY